MPRRSIRSRRTLVLLLPALLLAPASAMPAAPDPDPDPPGCTAGGETITDRDHALALAACERARERFRALLGEPVPRVVVLVEPREGYRTGVDEGIAVVFWPTSSALAERVGRPVDSPHVGAHWSDVLPHEIAHALLAARFFPDGEFETTGYGTPLPDWLEEGVAIWAEPESSRRARLADARSLPPHRRDLRAILDGEHPAVLDPAVMGIRDGAPVRPDEAAYDFYSQSIAVVSFFHAMGGPAAILELGRRFVEPDRAASEPGALEGVPGVPAVLDDLVVRWEAWLD